MSTDLKNWQADREQIVRWMEELHRANEDFDMFVDGQLDELERLWGRLEAQQRDVAEQGVALRNQVDELGASQRRLDEAAAATQGCINQLREAAQSALADNQGAINDQLRKFSTGQQEVQEQLEASLARVNSVVETATADFAEARADLAAARDALREDGLKLADMAEPLRAVLTAHQEAVERVLRAEQIVQAANEVSEPPPSEKAPPAADFTAEVNEPGSVWQRTLRRARGADRVDKTASAAPQAPEPTKKGVPAGGGATTDDPVLDAVMAQFEMLHNDLSGRRTKKAASKS